MYCSLDKIDLAATVDGRQVAIQTDHRGTAEIEAEPELSALFAMARVLNARSHLAELEPDAVVRYVLAEPPPPVLREALEAVGATIEQFAIPGAAGARSPAEGGGSVTAPPQPERAGSLAEQAAGELADRCFRDLAQRAAARVGTRDLAIALRMLEDQTAAAPPARSDEPEYWQRVLELAALAGELLRAKYPGGHWVHSDRALVPFGFQLGTSGPAGTTVLFPTNRAQRVIEDGADESLFKLLIAAEETMRGPPDVATGRLMPSLRDRRNVELDEVVWRALIEGTASDVPVVVCGIDGESTFGMIRREALGRPPAEAWAEALANLAEEPVEREWLEAGGLGLVAVTGSFYAAEKLLDRAFLRAIHAELRSDLLAAAAPVRGLLLVTTAHDTSGLARFGTIARLRHDDAGGRAISPAVLLVEDGVVVGYVQERLERAEPRGGVGDTSPETPKRPGLLRRLLGRK
jgi:hypothetical protein